MPTLGFHVPDDSPLISQVKERAKVRHAGKVSAYVGELVKNDLLVAAGLAERRRMPDVLDPDILVTLTRDLLGRLDASIMEEMMEGKDQRLELRQILRAHLSKTHELNLVAEPPPPTPKRKFPPHDREQPA